MQVLKAKLLDLERQKRDDEIASIRGDTKKVDFGSQIRSYVLQPYQMIKDHRTKVEVGDVNRVLDGDLDPFIKTYLLKKASGTLGAPAAADED
jgi:peptide chain release factor 2